METCDNCGKKCNPEKMKPVNNPKGIGMVLVCLDCYDKIKYPSHDNFHIGNVCMFGNFR